MCFISLLIIHAAPTVSGYEDDIMSLSISVKFGVPDIFLDIPRNQSDNKNPVRVRIF